MTRAFFISIAFMLSCAQNKEPSAKDLPASIFKLNQESQTVKEAYDHIFEQDKFVQGADTLEKYLSVISYDSSLFYPYHALAYSYIMIGKLERADSVHKLIDRDGLNGIEEMEWLSVASEIHLQFSRFGLVKELIYEGYRHPASKVPHWLEDNLFFNELWMVSSLLEDCDSAKYYLEKYLISLREHERIRTWQRIDSSKMAYFENQLETPCPLMDSVGLTLPSLTFRY